MGVELVETGGQEEWLTNDDGYYYQEWKLNHRPSRGVVLWGGWECVNVLNRVLTPLY